MTQEHEDAPEIRNVKAENRFYAVVDGRDFSRPLHERQGEWAHEQHHLKENDEITLERERQHQERDALKAELKRKEREIILRHEEVIADMVAVHRKAADEEIEALQEKHQEALDEMQEALMEALLFKRNQMRRTEYEQEKKAVEYELDSFRATQGLEIKKINARFLRDKAAVRAEVKITMDKEILDARYAFDDAETDLLAEFELRKTEAEKRAKRRLVEQQAENVVRKFQGQVRAGQTKKQMKVLADNLMFAACITGMVAAAEEANKHGSSYLRKLESGQQLWELAAFHNNEDMATFLRGERDKILAQRQREKDRAREDAEEKATAMERRLMARQDKMSRQYRSDLKMQALIARKRKEMAVVSERIRERDERTGWQVSHGKIVAARKAAHRRRQDTILELVERQRAAARAAVRHKQRVEANHRREQAENDEMAREDTLAAMHRRHAAHHRGEHPNLLECAQAARHQEHVGETADADARVQARVRGARAAIIEARKAGEKYRQRSPSPPQSRSPSPPRDAGSPPKPLAATAATAAAPTAPAAAAVSAPAMTGVGVGRPSSAVPGGVVSTALGMFPLPSTACGPQTRPASAAVGPSKSPPLMMQKPARRRPSTAVPDARRPAPTASARARSPTHPQSASASKHRSKLAKAEAGARSDGASPAIAGGGALARAGHQHLASMASVVAYKQASLYLGETPQVPAGGLNWNNRFGFREDRQVVHVQPFEFKPLSPPPKPGPIGKPGFWIDRVEHKDRTSGTRRSKSK